MFTTTLHYSDQHYTLEKIVYQLKQTEAQTMRIHLKQHMLGRFCIVNRWIVLPIC